MKSYALQTSVDKLIKEIDDNQLIIGSGDNGTGYSTIHIGNSTSPAPIIFNGDIGHPTSPAPVVFNGNIRSSSDIELYGRLLLTKDSLQDPLVSISTDVSTDTKNAKLQLIGAKQLVIDGSKAATPDAKVPGVKIPPLITVTQANVESDANVTLTGDTQMIAGGNCQCGNLQVIGTGNVSTEQGCILSKFCPPSGYADVSARHLS